MDVDKRNQANGPPRNMDLGELDTFGASIRLLRDIGLIPQRIGFTGVPPNALPKPLLPSIGIALGGGGSRGAFGVGAAEYLLGTLLQGSGANVITGTSVGSLTALKLAEEPPGRQDRMVAELVYIWRQLQDNRDMWDYEPWLAPSLNDPLLGGTVRSTLEKAAGIYVSKDSFQPPSVSGINTFDPVLNSIGAAVLAHGVLSNPLGATLLLQRVATLAAPIASGAMALFNISPIEAATRQSHRFGMTAANENSGTVKLRLVAVSLEEGEAHYIAGNGIVLRRDNRTQVSSAPFLADMVSGAIASSTMPVYFPPVVMNGQCSLDAPGMPRPAASCRSLPLSATRSTGFRAFLNPAHDS